MKDKGPLLNQQSAALLFEGSLKSIPFNVILAATIAVNLFFNKAPTWLILAWFVAILFVSCLRLVFSKHVICQKYQPEKINRNLYLFLFLTLLTGSMWSGCFFIFDPYVNGVHESVIILILGGMAAGAIASLSVYLPAYYAYLLPMFLPLIVFNLWRMEPERTILAIVYTLFVIMLMMSAKINSKLLHKTFELSKEKDHLIGKLTLTNEKLEKSVEEVRILSITDSLTGLYNRRFFDNSLRNEIARAKRNQQNIHLIMIDIDNFKYINDTYGHPYGDTFLVFVAETIKASLRRTTDVVFRIGGDEFAAILTNVDHEVSVHLCQKIQSDFQAKNKHENISLSMSIVNISSSYASAVE